MFKKVLIASAVLIAAAGAHAQSSAVITMTGTISPGTCTVTLGGAAAGVADFGTSTAATVRASTLVAGTNPHYDMGTKTFTWNVACTAATPLQLAFTDAQSGKVVPMNASTDSQRFGLVDGASGTTAIGSYGLSFAAGTVAADGATPKGYLSAPIGANSGWVSTYGLTIVPQRAVGFMTATTAQSTPSAITTASGTLSVNVLLSKAYADVATKNIVLNGGGTITLQYL
jgi:type 1 fimbria pilin